MAQTSEKRDDEQSALAYRVLTDCPHIIFIVDASGLITWVGENLGPLTGYVVDDLVGTYMLDHIDVDWNPLVLHPLNHRDIFPHPKSLHRTPVRLT